jgi:cell division transport system permease protein
MAKLPSLRGVKGAPALLAPARMGPVLWVIAVMTCLAMLGLAAALGLTPTAAGLSQQIAGRATIQIVQADAGARRADVAALSDALRGAPFVAGVDVVSEQRIDAMAAQWLGDGVRDTGLPLPALIDVDLRPGEGQAMRRLTQTVHRVAPEARVIPHARWLQPVARLIGVIGWLAAGIAALLIAAAAAVAVVAARGALAAQRSVIDVLHLVGATDVQVARLFQRRTAWEVSLGAVLGAAVAIAVTVTIFVMTSGMTSGLTAGDPGAANWLWLWMLAVPPAIILIATFAARRAVIAVLKAMP